MPQKLKDIALLFAPSQYSLRQVLFEDFKSIKELPIQGGWGYTQEDAIIIDRSDPIVDPSKSFFGVDIEYVIVEKRIYEELIIFREAGTKFSGIEWKLQTQRLISNANRHYDHLAYKVTCFHDHDWNMLKEEMTQSDKDPNFSLVEHFKKREELQCYYFTDYFFDITSFYGKPARRPL